MRHLLSFLLNLALLLTAAITGFFAGALSPSLHLTRVISQTATSVQTYDFSWLAATVLMYLLLLAISAMRGRLRQHSVRTTAAFVAVVLCLAIFTRIGLRETPLY